MKETPNHKIRYPEPSDPNAITADMRHIAEDTERELDAIEPSQLVGGAAGQLVIVDGTGAGAYKAMKGDATFAADGTLTIANGAVTNPKIGAKAVGAENLNENAVTAAAIAADAVGSSEIAAGAVGNSELADGGVTSRKTKLTAGVKRGASTSTLTSAFADVALSGGNLEITPAVESVLLLTATFRFELKAEPVEAAGTIRLDSEDQTPRAILQQGTGAVAPLTATVSQVYVLTLSAAAHTIKMRAARTGGAETGNNINGQMSGLHYVLLAA